MKKEFNLMAFLRFKSKEAGDFRSFFGTNVLPQKSYINQIRVMPFDTGTIDSGSFSLYGIRFS